MSGTTAHILFHSHNLATSCTRAAKEKFLCELPSLGVNGPPFDKTGEGNSQNADKLARTLLTV